MKPHPHAEVIKAWADGMTIQILTPQSGDAIWLDADEPIWSLIRPWEVRIKPEPPAKTYPETLMKECDLCSAYYNGANVIGPSAELKAFQRIANAALRHAIDAGQVVVPDGAIRTVYNWMSAARDARDMAIAEAVRLQCEIVTDDICELDLAAIIAKVK